jgi:hypothetical protein
MAEHLLIIILAPNNNIGVKVFAPGTFLANQKIYKTHVEGIP